MKSQTKPIALLKTSALWLLKATMVLVLTYLTTNLFLIIVNRIFVWAKEGAPSNLWWDDYFMLLSQGFPITIVYIIALAATFQCINLFVKKVLDYQINHILLGSILGIVSGMAIFLAYPNTIWLFPIPYILAFAGFTIGMYYYLISINMPSKRLKNRS